MLTTVRNASLLLRFLLELAVYASVGYWGFTAPSRVAGQWLAGLGAPALLILAWGLFGSPRARFPLRGPARAGFETAWFGAGALALSAAGQVPPAIALAALFAADAALLQVALGSSCNESNRDQVHSLS
jgi:hypothetical protein